MRFVLSLMLTRMLKKQIFWLGPQDIAQLVLHQRALLEAMY